MDELTTNQNTATCEARLWKRGEDYRCAQSVGVVRWQDFSERDHTGCPRHVEGLQHRWPAVLLESVAEHGRLDLTTPWARGLFGPNDRVAVENLIPPEWTLGVSVSPDRSRLILWALGPDGTLAVDRSDTCRVRNAVAGATSLALTLQALAGDPPEPAWLHESVPA